MTIHEESHRAARGNSLSHEAMDDFGEVSLDLAIAQKRIQSLKSEYLNIDKSINKLQQEDLALRAQLKQLETESASCNWCATSM